MIIRFSNETDLLRALEMCEQLNYRWRAGQKPIEYYPFIIGSLESNCFLYLEIHNKKITYSFGNGDGDAWDENFEKSISANEFFNTFKQQNGVYILN